MLSFKTPRDKAEFDGFINSFSMILIVSFFIILTSVSLLIMYEHPLTDTQAVLIISVDNLALGISLRIWYNIRRNGNLLSNFIINNMLLLFSVHATIGVSVIFFLADKQAGIFMAISIAIYLGFIRNIANAGKRLYSG